GGGLGPSPRFGHRLGGFVPPERVVEVCAGITALFRDHGYRRVRSKSRLKFLMKDWGPERFREVLERDYLDGPLEDGPAPPDSPAAHRDHLGRTPQKDGRVAVGFAPVAGRITGTQLVRAAELARRYGQGRLRTTAQQKMLVLDVPQAEASELEEELSAAGLAARPSAARAGVLACTGIEFCKLAVVETKHRAGWVIEELERRLPGLAERVRINLNGCPNSCARYQLADIGLMGSLVPGDNGHRVDGFQIHLGGQLGDERRFGRKVKGVRVRAEELPDFLEFLIRVWLGERDEGETFSAWVNRLPESELQGVMALATE
ncbi:MAG TPA: nitrite/sulfite reductase, partial [Actinomycetota bacterium]|nr:nitrite/sulfite reductase [Actinomycetota bacterium]